MEQAHARRDLPSYYRVNRAIHDRINAIAGNPVLTHTFRTLNARLHALRFRSNLVQAKWDKAVQEHREMVEALGGARRGTTARSAGEPPAHKQRAVLETMGEQ
jgi:DNA-binding GntR family transcriptional regulator